MLLLNAITTSELVRLDFFLLTSSVFPKYKPIPRTGTELLLHFTWNRETPRFCSFNLGDGIKMLFYQRPNIITWDVLSLSCKKAWELFSPVLCRRLVRLDWNIWIEPKVLFLVLFERSRYSSAIFASDIKVREKAQRKPQTWENPFSLSTNTAVIWKVNVKRGEHFVRFHNHISSHFWPGS